MKLSVEIILIIIIGIIILFNACYENEHFADVAGTTIAGADIDAIRNLNSYAKTLMQPDGTLTNPGNLNVAGKVVSTMGTEWGMLWGDQCALIGKAGKPMRFGFANDTNANGWKEVSRFDPDGKLTTNNTVTMNGQWNINPHLILKNTYPSWANEATFAAYRFIKTESATKPEDGNFKQFHVGAGGVSIGQDYTPPYNSPDALYVKGNTDINGKLSATNFFMNSVVWVQPGRDYNGTDTPTTLILPGAGVYLLSAVNNIASDWFCFAWYLINSDNTSKVIGWIQINNCYLGVLSSRVVTIKVPGGDRMNIDWTVSAIKIG